MRARDAGAELSGCEAIFARSVRKFSRYTSAIFAFPLDWSTTDPPREREVLWRVVQVPARDLTHARLDLTLRDRRIISSWPAAWIPSSHAAALETGSDVRRKFRFNVRTSLRSGYRES